MSRHLRFLACVVWVAIFAGAGAKVVRAQSEYPVTPDAASCVVEPRTVEELIALFASATPVAEPTTPSSVEVPVGDPALAADVEGVTVTIHQAFACLNAGEFLRFFSLLTDDTITTQFPWIGEIIAADDFSAEEFAQPQPMPAEGLQTILAISNVMTLGPGGHAGAFVTFIDPQSDRPGPSVMFLTLTWQDDRWLIAGVEEFR